MTVGETASITIPSADSNGGSNFAAVAEVQSTTHIVVADHVFLSDLALNIGDTKQAEIAPAVPGQALTGIVWTSDHPDIFLGWFDSIAGGNQVSPDHVYTEDTTLYARWQKENPLPYEYTVTFHTPDLNIDILVPMNEAIGARMPEAPVREGCRFIGWNTEPVTADTVIDYTLDDYVQKGVVVRFKVRSRAGLYHRRRRR